jgi:hypothetical protein
MADTGHLKTQLNELVKQHIEYDGNSRPEYVYTAHADLEDGKPCSVVRYSYDGTSSRVVFMKEYEGTWDESWEVF